MINIRTADEIRKLEKAGSIVYETHQYLKPYIKAGINLKELDMLADKFIIEVKKSHPSFKNLYGFPGSICISVNDTVVHGIPGDYILKDGDIVSLDIGAEYKGYHGDSAWTYPVGKVDDDTLYLLEHTEKALYEGIKKAVPGGYTGDIGAAVESYAIKHNLGVVKELVGHGVGQSVHEEPDVPNYGKAGTGTKLKAGMVIAIEPMLTFGSEEIYQEDDGWTIRTIDKSNSAHFEHTVAITEDGPKILTGV